jgi:nucleotide-binding universal stress UspA family protein
MFTRLLIPLDGSKLAEAVLPAAAYLARTLEIPVTLLHIIERNAPEEIHGEAHLTNEVEAQAYLEAVARQEHWPEVAVESHVHTAEVTNVAESIAAHANELQTDLIVLCTHGRGGLRSLVFASIAQQVINLGKTPVLVIQADQAGVSPVFTCRKMLVALDGKPDHEKGLRVAAEFGGECGASLHLVTVVPTRRELLMEQAATARFLPGSTSAMLDLSVAGVENYLQALVHQYAQKGLAVTAEVLRGDPAAMLVRAAEQSQANLIVLGTHGKSLMDAFWSGSLTPQIAKGTRIPLLLVPIRDHNEV